MFDVEPGLPRWLGAVIRRPLIGQFESAEVEAEWRFTELFKAKIEGDCSHEDSLAQVGSNQLFQGETFIPLIPSLGKFDSYQIPGSLTHRYAMENHVPRNPRIGPSVVIAVLRLWNRTIVMEGA
jgi:hypothetical protein